MVVMSCWARYAPDICMDYVDCYEALNAGQQSLIRLHIKRRVSSGRERAMCQHSSVTEL